MTAATGEILVELDRVGVIRCSGWAEAGDCGWSNWGDVEVDCVVSGMIGAGITSVVDDCLVKGGIVGK